MSGICGDHVAGGGDDFMNGDVGYVGIESREENRNDEHLSKVEYRSGNEGTVRLPENEVSWDRKEYLQLCMLVLSVNLVKRAWTKGAPVRGKRR